MPFSMGCLVIGAVKVMLRSDAVIQCLPVVSGRSSQWHPLVLVLAVCSAR